MAFLRIGAEKFKMLGRFFGDSRCAVACHKLDDRQSWDKELSANLESDEDFLVAPSLDALAE